MRFETCGISCLVLYCVSLPALAAAYTDYETEISTTLSQRVPAQEVVWLNAAGRKFISLYLVPAAGTVRGAVIIAHGMGAHADWPEVIAPLRTRLPDSGWATLSLQMPILPPGAPLADYGRTIKDSSQRLNAAVRYLRQHGFINLVFIGYGFGAALIADFLAHNPVKGFNAFVAISAQSHDFLNPRLKLLNDLESIDVPVLDVYAGRDRGKVVKQADDRRLAGRKNSGHIYDQIMIIDADRFYTGVEKALISGICGWLDTKVPQVPASEDKIPDGNIKPEIGEKSDE